MKVKTLVSAGLLLLVVSLAVNVMMLKRNDNPSPAQAVAVQTRPVQKSPADLQPARNTATEQDRSFTGIHPAPPELKFEPERTGDFSDRLGLNGVFLNLEDAVTGKPEPPDSMPADHSMKVIYHSGVWLPEARNPVLLRGDLQDVRPVTLLANPPAERGVE